MARIIFPLDFWKQERLPDIPEQIIPPPEFSKEQASDFVLAFNILKLIDKENGDRRTITGINRAAQRRWPDRGVNIMFVHSLLDSWTAAGYLGVRDMMAQGKFDFGEEGRQYAQIFHELKSLAIVAASDIGENEEVFAIGKYLVEITEGRNPPWRYYRVAAETNYGVYIFVVICHQVPEWRDIDHYCVYHTKRSS